MDFFVCSLPLAVAATDRWCNVVHRGVSEVESSTRIGFGCVPFVTNVSCKHRDRGGGEATLMDMI